MCMPYLSTNKTLIKNNGKVQNAVISSKSIFMASNFFMQMLLVGCWLCWGLTSQSTIFQSYRDIAIASWVINQYFRGVKCLAQGHNTAAVGLKPRTSRSGVRHSTTEPPRSPHANVQCVYSVYAKNQIASIKDLVQVDFPMNALTEHI